MSKGFGTLDEIIKEGMKKMIGGIAWKGKDILKSEEYIMEKSWI